MQGHLIMQVTLKQSQKVSRKKYKTVPQSTKVKKYLSSDQTLNTFFIAHHSWVKIRRHVIGILHSYNIQ